VVPINIMGLIDANAAFGGNVDTRAVLAGALFAMVNLPAMAQCLILLSWLSFALNHPIICQPVAPDAIPRVLLPTTPPSTSTKKKN
jgi:hypothetical protein